MQITRIPTKPYLVTTQNPNSPRERHILWTISTFDAINEVMSTTHTADCYISAKPASADDCINYPVYRA